MKIHLVVVAIAVCALMAPAVLRANEERLNDSAAVLTDMAGMGDKGIPADLIKSAKCLVIIPAVKKAAMGLGGEYGKGYLTCRKADGSWSAPGAVSVKGGSAGFQIGGVSTDVIMVVKNEKGAEKLLASKFTVGADGTVAAGPVGRQAAAQTDATMNAEILAYSRAKGVFAGIALDGATFTTDQSENKALYGKEIDNKSIVLQNTVQPPPAAAPLMRVLAKY